MINLLNINLSEICIIEKKQSYLSTIPIMKETLTTDTLENEIEKIIAETKKQKIHSLHDAVYGSMISIEDLYEYKFNNYYALYVEVPNPSSKKGLHIQPSGKYIRTFCKGIWDKLSDKYKEILAYVKRQGLSLKGYSYETGINESVIENFDDYITQIEIPIN